MLFWTIAALIGLAAVLITLRPALTRAKADQDAANRDVEVFKDQLRELESDLERGVVSPEDAETTRTELSRRLLAAAKRDAQEMRAEPGWTRFVAAGVMIAAIGAAMLVYWQYGAPGLPDRPLQARLDQLEIQQERRLSQADAEAFIAANDAGIELPDVNQPDQRQVELVAELEEVLKDRPNDLRGHELLAVNLAEIGRFADARKALQQVIAIKGETATATDYTMLVEFMFLAARGYVSPESEQALARALTLDRTHPQARYYAGLAAVQANLFEQALVIWQALLEEGPPDAPWVLAIEAQIDEVAAAADRPALAGPSEEDIQAAGEMSEDDRDEMIRGMVEGLSERLATQGGTPDEWAQLIRALGVLGETERAAAIWEEAQTVFAGSPAAIDLIREAAQSAGIAQ